VSDTAKERFLRLLRLAQTGDLIAANKAVSVALRTTPKDPNLLHLAAQIAEGRQDIERAVQFYQRAAAAAPHWFEGTMNWVRLLAIQKDYAQALDLLSNLALHHPDRLEIPEAQARLSQSAGKLSDAVLFWEKVLSKVPSHKEGLGQLLFCKRQICDWSSEPVTLDHALPPNMTAILFDAPEIQKKSAKDFCDKHFAQITPLAMSSPWGHAKKRIGYLSSDFHAHATSWLIAELFTLHDREQFEIFAYSYGVEDHSDIRARLRSEADHFIELNALTPAQCAQRIRADEIDILIDLKGHTQGARLDILAHRPAPVQIHWLGFPATTGASFVDGFIADNITVPLEYENEFTEAIYRLPHSYQINDRQKSVSTPLTKEAYGLPPKAFVFASFNQTYKITPKVFALWCELLCEISGSVLWLYESNSFAATNLRHVAQGYGIESSRLVFAKPAPLADHLARYHVVDLALDTFHVGGHTTTSDALWVGAPVITRAGKSFVSRVAASLLTAAELPELITQTDEEYKVLALSLARQPQKLQALRHHLTTKRLTLPLFDTPRFVKDFEAVLHTISP